MQTSATDALHAHAAACLSRVWKRDACVLLAHSPCMPTCKYSCLLDQRDGMEPGVFTWIAGLQGRSTTIFNAGERCVHMLDVHAHAVATTSAAGASMHGCMMMSQ